MTDYTQNWLQAKENAQKHNLKIVEIGWEQHVIIDEQKQIVYRYPRHQAAADKLADEVAVLHDIHEQEWQVSLPVMRQHTEIFTSYDYIPGEVLTSERVDTLTPDELQAIGQELGTFLVQFHNLNPEIVAQKQTKQSTSLLEYYSERIMTASETAFYDKAVSALSKLTGLGDQSSDVVVHGDLHGPNIVIDPETNRLTGVIDLSEMETGDPHLEFRKIFMTFPGSLDATIVSYQEHGGQKIDREKVVLWAYVNEWANVCHFASEPENGTYQRALEHLMGWRQL